MSRKIAPSEAKAQEHTALLQGQTTVASDEELLQYPRRLRKTEGGLNGVNAA